MASLTSFFLLWASHPPRQSPESAYLFLLPVLIWFHFRPSFRKTLICILLSGWVYQIMMVGWMRHISMGGMITATFLLSCFQSVWFLWQDHGLGESIFSHSRQDFSSLWDFLAFGLPLNGFVLFSPSVSPGVLCLLRSGSARFFCSLLRLGVAGQFLFSLFSSTCALRPICTICWYVGTKRRVSLIVLSAQTCTLQC